MGRFGLNDMNDLMEFAFYPDQEMVKHEPENNTLGPN